MAKIPVGRVVRAPNGAVYISWKIGSEMISFLGETLYIEDGKPEVVQPAPYTVPNPETGD